MNIHLVKVSSACYTSVWKMVISPATIPVKSVAVLKYSVQREDYIREIMSIYGSYVADNVSKSCRKCYTCPKMHCDTVDTWSFTTEELTDKDLIKMWSYPFIVPKDATPAKDYIKKE